MGALDPTFVLYLDCPTNGREEIVRGKDPFRIRRIATGRSFTKRVAARGGRKAVITKDNKVLQGGAAALDRICYQKWLEDHQPEEDGSTRPA
jgi:hypothetical protein